MIGPIYTINLFTTPIGILVPPKYCLMLANILTSTSSPKSSFLLTNRSDKPPLAHRLMDPSSETETTYAMLGIGVGEFPDPRTVIACTSQEQSSQDGSRRMLFPLKTDNFIRRKKKKKKKRGRICVWKYWKLGDGSAATACWVSQIKCQWCRLLQCSVMVSPFLQGLAKR